MCESCEKLQGPDRVELSNIFEIQDFEGSDSVIGITLSFPKGKGLSAAKILFEVANDPEFQESIYETLVEGNDRQTVESVFKEQLKSL